MAKTQPKHRAAKHRAEPQKRGLRKHGLVALAAPVAATVTVSVVGLAVQASPPAESGEAVVSQASLDRLSERAVSLSRSGARVDVQASAESRAQEARADRAAAERREERATEQAVAAADDRLWTTTELNLWPASDADGEQLGVLDAEEKVLVTGRSRDGRQEIVLDGESRWVTEGYLSEEKPAETGLDVTCTNGSTIATPVSENIVDVHQVVCGNFPDITTYGTLRSDGEHSQGLAIDIMVSGDRGYEVAEFLKANYAELGINYIIYSQHIWSVDRSGEGWRAMEDRGSTTANHYDHVHVTTY